jgi:hypothetical protein
MIIIFIINNNIIIIIIKIIILIKIEVMNRDILNGFKLRKLNRRRLKIRIRIIKILLKNKKRFE